MPLDLWAIKPTIDRYLYAHSPGLSAYSFISIYLWQDFFSFDITISDDALYVFASDAGGEFLYWLPLGRNLSAPSLEASFKRMSARNRSRGLSRIENVGSEQLGYFPDDRFQAYQRGQEYLYRRLDIADLKGDAYKSKRHAINHFLKCCPAEYYPYEDGMREECLALYDRWAMVKMQKITDPLHKAMLEDNRIVLKRALEDPRRLGLLGRTVVTRGMVIAFTFGYFLNEQTFCDLFEIADPSFPESASLIFSRLCGDEVLRNVSWINAMDTEVPENVNRAKMSYRPWAMLPVYSVRERQ